MKNNDDELSPREKEVCREMKKEGFNGEKNAADMFIERSTYYKHIENIYRKKKIHNSADLMKYIFEHPSEIEK